MQSLPRDSPQNRVEPRRFVNFLKSISIFGKPVYNKTYRLPPGKGGKNQEAEQ